MLGLGLGPTGLGLSGLDYITGYLTNFNTSCANGNGNEYSTIFSVLKLVVELHHIASRESLLLFQ